jgi:hypothetical protein
VDKKYNEKLSLIAMLVELNSTDGEASEEENDFINRLADLYKIEPVELLQIKSGKFKPELSIPKMESDRIPFFQTCVMAMGVDLKVNDEEKKYCSELGMKMGLREEVIGVVMDLFEKHFPNPVPITELMNAYNIGRN